LGGAGFREPSFSGQKAAEASSERERLRSRACQRPIALLTKARAHYQAHIALSQQWRAAQLTKAGNGVFNRGTVLRRIYYTLRCTWETNIFIRALQRGCTGAVKTDAACMDIIDGFGRRVGGHRCFAFIGQGAADLQI
jgi:hypothetical protein